MRTGKLNDIELNIALSPLKTHGDGIVRGAELGQDCAIVELNGDVLITTDPITCPVDDPFQLAMTVNSNDIYAGGGVPRYAMLTVLAPTDYDANKLAIEIADIGAKSKEVGIHIIGGHTEFTDGVNRLIVSVTMIGQYANKPIISGKIRVGDKIMVTKSLGLEASHIILDNDKSLIGNISINEINELNSHSLSVAVESVALQEDNVQVSSMHDVTEGGVYGACCEIIAAAGLSAVIYEELLPVLPITARLADKYGLHVGRIISSGSMLIVASDAEKVIKSIKNRGVTTTIIGEVVADGGIRVVCKSGEEEIITIKPDEIYLLPKRQ